MPLRVYDFHFLTSNFHFTPPFFHITTSIFHFPTSKADRVAFIGHLQAGYRPIHTTTQHEPLNPGNLPGTLITEWYAGSWASPGLVRIRSNIVENEDRCMGLAGGASVSTHVLLYTHFCTSFPPLLTLHHLSLHRSLPSLLIPPCLVPSLPCRDVLHTSLFRVRLLWSLFQPLS